MKHAVIPTVLAVFALGGTALAQATAPPVDLEGDIARWFLDLSILGGVVAAIVGFIRKRVWVTLDGIAVNVVAVVVGVAITLAGKPLELHVMPWIPAILYGAGAGLLASGLVELGRTVAGKRLGG